MNCEDQRHLGLCLGCVPAFTYGSWRVSDQGTTLRASDLHNARATIHNHFNNSWRTRVIERFSTSFKLFRQVNQQVTRGFSYQRASNVGCRYAFAGEPEEAVWQTVNILVIWDGKTLNWIRFSVLKGFPVPAPECLVRSIANICWQLKKVHLVVHGSRHTTDLLWEKFQLIIPLYMKPISFQSKASIVCSATATVSIDFCLKKLNVFSQYIGQKTNEYLNSTEQIPWNWNVDQLSILITS